MKQYSKTKTQYLKNVIKSSKNIDELYNYIYEVYSNFRSSRIERIKGLVKFIQQLKQNKNRNFAHNFWKNKILDYVDIMTNGIVYKID